MKKLVALLVFISLEMLGCGSRPLRFHVEFRESPGLKRGSEVRYLGVGVGQVERVSLVQERSTGSSPQVDIAVAISNRQVQIRHDDSFGLATEGLLGGEYLDITPGPSTSPVVEEGSTVEGQAANLPLEKVLKVLDAYGLTKRLDALPKPRREQLLKTFNALLDDAIKEQPQNKSKPSQPTGTCR
jgi:phospholipid/cholesterol/gamma-HCH transport system substrate-binding protein